MMQGQLFRNSDPATSAMAAEELQTRLGKVHRRVMEIVTSRGVACTANEIAVLCSDRFGGMVETYRKRLRELERLGLVIRCEDRRCKVTGRSAHTWRAYNK